MRKKAVSQDFEGLLHTVAQTVADTGTLFKTFLMVFFEPAFMGRGKILWQAAPVCQAEKEKKGREVFAFKDVLKVKLDVGVAGKFVACPNQPKAKTVGYYTPKVVSEIEILLNRGLGRQFQPLGTSVKILAKTHDVNRGRRWRFICPMRNGKKPSGDFLGLFDKYRIVTKEG
ncbi:hypothetical protein [Thermosulfurimonas sp. F29]|uniref:hypothetical protein n=1 Tax=Thermosulfurimonas sp. F29 TaxID=2867247 RepID=UPI001C83FDE3|nr:hypothetical protein [Thermosulfurimonas sp. F29]MBX6422499.1 hypothetical protein [Thermosulfurimonas sp. F29]